MTNDLVTDADLEPFPGAPFAEGIIDGAVATLRNYAGWHIAPARQQTVTLDSRGGRYLFLPSLHVNSITLVEDVTGAEPVPLTDWFQAGPTLVRESGWPLREAAVRVTMNHGHDVCPPDLFGAIAELCQAASRDTRLSGQSVGPYSESFHSSRGINILASHPAAGYYRVPRRNG